MAKWEARDQKVRRDALYAQQDAEKAAADAARAKRERDERIACLLKRAERYEGCRKIVQKLIDDDKLDTATTYLDQQETGG